MKPTHISILAIVLVLMAPARALYAQTAVGTAFTYQGQLKQAGEPVEDTADFEFTLWDAAFGGNPVGDPNGVSADNLTVDNGLFTVVLDFGDNIFVGEARWLEIAVRVPAGGGAFTTLAPRQELTPAPYALALPGVWTQPNTTSPNVIAGHADNTVKPGAIGATISGGGAHTANAHTVYDYYGTIGGGRGNQAGTDDATPENAEYATVAGGRDNAAANEEATVGGGRGNTAQGPGATISGGYGNSTSSNAATVGGGQNNTAAAWGTVAGGINNTAYINSAVGGGCANTASGSYATVAGGEDNVASGDHAAIPGGRFNTADGRYSFAAGYRAKALEQGSFVWADYATEDFTATAENQFLIRAAGGVGINTNAPSSPLTVDGMIESLTGGFRFPDGTTQNTAAAGGGDGHSLDADDGDPTDVVYVDSDGKVGIGTLTPIYDLDIAGGVKAEYSGMILSGAGLYGSSAPLNGIGVRGEATHTSGANYGVHGITHSPNGYAGYFEGGRNYFEGNVGVGTDDPQAKLHIAGTPGTDGVMFPDGTLQTTAAIGGWSLAGNAGTDPNSNFIGTTDDVALELQVDSRRALRIEPGPVDQAPPWARHAPNWLAGWEGNAITSGVRGATISGGGFSFNFIDQPNQVTDDYGTVSGGRNNTAGDDSGETFDASDATVGGGIANTASGEAATVGGGVANIADGAYATVPGGRYNLAGGTYSFAAGNHACATHYGSFVWGGSPDVDFETTAPDQFLIRSSGGVGIGTNSPDEQLHVNGNVKAEGLLESTGGGVRFPDGTTQTTAADPAGGGVPSGFCILGESAVPPPGYTYTGSYVVSDHGQPWCEREPMPTARRGAVAAAVNGRIYVIGGSDDGDHDTNEEYDVALNLWSTRPDMPTGRIEAGAAVLDGMIYVVGGYDGDTLFNTNERYDPTTHTWSAAPSMPTARCSIAVAAVDGRLYVAGGSISGSPHSAVFEEFDPQTGWTAKALLLYAREGAAAAAVDGKIYLIGGHSATYLSSCHVYDPTSDSWSAYSADMPTARAGLVCVPVNGKIYAIGGYDFIPKATNEVYDPAADTWMSKTHMVYARSKAAGSVVNGKIYIIGGYDGEDRRATQEYTVASEATFHLHRKD